MVSKKFILNADDFGMSKAHNRAVLVGYHNGFLSSASLCANGKAFNAGVNEIIPECPNLGLGVHLNIIEGRSLTKAPLLTNKRGKFNNGYLQLLLKSNDPKFLNEVEFEFRTQIETILNYTKVDHIDSHVHTHAIPNIFKITARLAKEYKVDGVIDVNLKFCSLYDVEGYTVERALKEAGIPVMGIETDYTDNDAEQLRTRIGAFIEMIGTK